MDLKHGENKKMPPDILGIHHIVIIDAGKTDERGVAKRRGIAKRELRELLGVGAPKCYEFETDGHRYYKFEFTFPTHPRIKGIKPRKTPDLSGLEKMTGFVSYERGRIVQYH